MAATNLFNNDDARLYKGSTSDGLVVFDTSYTMPSPMSTSHPLIGVPASIALGLTECCVKERIGMVGN